ncbi:MAG: efflux RND transporter periplasmic adaptor subunit [Sulfurimonadaceae bacterium]|nr:efflux RND transporter periplasmic adaptor subunit [Sulfurimonadaceae bacterium]
MPTIETSRSRKIITFAIVALIVLGGIGTSLYWMKNKPRAKRAAPKVLAPLVEAVTVKPISHRVVVSALGTVGAAQSVELMSRVSGEVIEVSPNLVPGARLQKGALIAQIDPADFELALRQKEADLVKARYELELELGQRAVAQREYELLGEEIAEEDRTLILREPHLRSARAKVDAAEAAVEQARLNLERTRIVAPFNAVVMERFVAVGMQLGSASKIATLVDSDRYWIEASLNVEEVGWIRFGDTPSDVTIAPRTAGQSYPKGKVKSVMSSVASKGRMARVVVEVADPIGGSEGTPLLLGDMVSLAIEGKVMKEVIKIPRSAMHHGNTIWLLSPQNRLKVVALKPQWMEKDAAYVAADTIAQDHRLIVSNLAAPVEGMTLRTRGAE